MIAVETHDLRHTYPAKGKAKEVLALKPTNFIVLKGEIFGFLGPNGSGKTTLFKILSSLVPPSCGGSASVFDHDLRADADAARKLIGVVFQHPSLDKKLTVEENLRHHGHLYGMKGEPLEQKITAQLESFGLADRRGDFVEKLSGGLRRRVELAKALLTSPKLLILDEPSTGLDPAARRELWDTITELKKSHGLTVMVTTHLGEEGDRCDSLVVLNEGRIVASGSPTKLKSQIGGDVITIQCDDPEALIKKMRETFSVKPTLVDGAIRIEMAQGHEFIPQVVEAFPGQVRAVTLGKPALEDVFIRLTGKALGTARTETQDE